MRKLLGIFAHPDDEVTVNGGTLAKYVRAGWKLDLVCATRGESGEWGDIEAAGRGLSEVRSQEIQESAQILGARSITFLDYKDGTLAQSPPGDIEEKLVGIMREIRPDIVITQETAGVTNHPDHIKLSYAATYAFQEHARERHYENPQDPNPPKLYYSCIPETIVGFTTKNKYFPAELFGKHVKGVEDKRITTIINIKSVASVKRKAFAAHATQEPVLSKYLNIPHNPFFIQEYFILRLVGLTEFFMGKNDRISDRL